MKALNRRSLCEKRPEPYWGTDWPLKNALCPYYLECLEKAIEARWPQFTCQDCMYQDLHVNTFPQPHEMEGHYRLLEKIFGMPR